ncbi:prepilin-type N-terminal cleavage/methylation domain-containing protein [bacterium]|nr:prepilin-type N-terminal cleavage/methylation domain-containing protein [bacterium]
MKKQNDRIGRASGFTLIELLTVTAISAILILSLNTVLYNAFNMRDNAYNSVSRYSAQQYAVNVMKRDFKNMMPPTENLIGDLIAEDAGGRNMPITQIEFYTTSGAMNDSGPWGDVQKVEYTVREIPGLRPEDDDSNRDYLFLVRSVEQNVLSETEEDPKYTPLLTDVAGFSVYFYDGSSWTETWDSSALSESASESEDEETELLPEAVRVRIMVYKHPEDIEKQGARNANNIETIEFIVPITIKSITQPDEEEETNSDNGDNSGGDTGGDNPGGDNNNGGQNPGGQQR